jgi:LysM repeat protein
MSPVFAPAAAPTAATHVPLAVVQKAKPAPWGWVSYTVRTGDTLSSIATHTATTPGVLAAHNHLRGGGNHLSVGQRLSVPRTAAQHRADVARARAAAAARAAHAKAAAAARAAAIRRATYTVRGGDTLGAIAARRGVTLAALLKTNRLSTRSVIHPGQKLRIPGSAARVGASRPVATRKAKVTTTTYRVRGGDTLSAIAARTKTPLRTLYSMNRLGPRSVIHPGQRLKVRGTAPAKAAAPRTAAYTVRSGETLSEIAARTGSTVAALVKANHLRNPNQVSTGQRLRVPVKAAPKATSANTFAGRTYPSSIINAANRNRTALARTAVPTRAQTKAMIVKTARSHGVDPKLALAVAWQESGWNQRQVSVANAIGVMQVIPSSGEWASQMAGRKLNLLRTQDNVTAGVVILRSLTRSAKNLDQAIAGYYQGLYSVQKNGMYADTKQYVTAIKAHRGRM